MTMNRESQKRLFYLTYTQTKMLQKNILAKIVF